MTLTTRSKFQRRHRPSRSAVLVIRSRSVSQATVVGCGAGGAPNLTLGSAQGHRRPPASRPLKVTW